MNRDMEPVWPQEPFWPRSSVIGSVMLVLLLLAAIPFPAQAQRHEYERCSHYSGACKRTCEAAVAMNCFDGSQSRVCDALTESWLHQCPLTNDTAPWACPCEGLNAGAAVWSDDFRSSFCFQSWIRDFLLRHNESILLHTTTEPGYQTCGIVDETDSRNVHLFSSVTTKDQRHACNESLKTIAANDGLTCP